MKGYQPEYCMSAPDGVEKSLAQQLDMIMNSGNLANLSNNISALGLPNLAGSTGLGGVGLGDSLFQN